MPSILQNESRGECITKGIAMGNKWLGYKHWALKPVIWRQRHVLECVKMTEVICKGRNSASLHSVSSFSTFIFRFWFTCCNFFLFLFYQPLLTSLFMSLFLSIPQPVKWLSNKRKSCLIMESGSFLLSYASRTHPAVCLLDIGVTLPLGRRPGRKSDYFSPLPPSSAQFKNTESYNFTPPHVVTLN